MNISSPLADCDLMIPNTPITIISTLPDKTTPITNSETVSPQFKGNVAILIIVIVVLITLLTIATFLAVTVILIVCRRSRNSTQNMNNTNAAHTATVELACSDARYVETEKKDALSIVASENAAYGAAATLTGLVNEQNVYEN